MTTETYAVRIRREVVLNGYSMSERNRRRLYRYLCRVMYGSNPTVASDARYIAAAKAAFGEHP